MLKYNLNNINDWNFDDSNIHKVYYNGDVCYQKITSGSTPPTPVGNKLVATYTGGTTYTLACNSSSTLASGETRPTGYDYVNMTDAVIGDCVTVIGMNAFSGTSLSSVTIPSSVTTIYSEAFESCYSLSSVTIPDSVTNIGPYSFNYCKSLTGITIPDSVTDIDSYAFNGCSAMTYAEIGSGITRIRLQAFNYCSGLTGITINATTPPTLDAANAFSNTNNCPIYVPCESVDAYKAATNWSTLASRIQAIPGSCPIPPYIQYEYLQGNGTSYILTDYKPNANTSLELDIEGRTVEGISDYESHFFGSYHYDPDNGNAGSKRFKLVYYGTSELRYDYALNQITTSSSAINSRGVIKMNSTGGYLNGTKVVSYTNSLDMSDNQCPIAVFDTAWYNIRNGEVVMQSTNFGGKRYRGKIYSVKIYEGDTLVRNYVPAICNGVVGLYETINNKMFGSEVSTPFTVGGTAVPVGLPTGYTELEYVQATGNSCINTNFMPNTNTRVVVDMQLTDTTTSEFPRLFGAGAWNCTGCTHVDYEGGKLRVGWFGQTGWRITNIATSTDRRVVDLNKNKLYVNNSQVASTTFSSLRQATENLGIFTYIDNGEPASGVDDVSRFFIGKLYSSQIYDNGVLIRYYVPTKRNSDNEYGLFDFVNNVFYYSVTNYPLTGGNS